MAIPHAQVYVPVVVGLSLSLPVPVIISLKPVKAPDHGHDQAPLLHSVSPYLCPISLVAWYNRSTC